MSNEVLTRYYMAYVILAFGLLVYGFFFFSKIKLAHWQFFRGRQREWAKKHEEVLHKICHWAFGIICMLNLAVMVPYILDTPYAIMHHYKKADGIATKVIFQNLQIDNEKLTYNINVRGLREGDYVELVYLPFTRYTTITKVYEIEGSH